MFIKTVATILTANVIAMLVLINQQYKSVDFLDSTSIAYEIKR